MAAKGALRRSVSKQNPAGQDIVYARYGAKGDVFVRRKCEVGRSFFCGGVVEYKRVESSFEKQKSGTKQRLFYGWQVQIPRDIFACASNKNTEDNFHAPFQP